MTATPPPCPVLSRKNSRDIEHPPPSMPPLDSFKLSGISLVQNVSGGCPHVRFPLLLKRHRGRRAEPQLGENTFLTIRCNFQKSRVFGFFGGSRQVSSATCSNFNSAHRSSKPAPCVCACARWFHTVQLCHRPGGAGPGQFHPPHPLFANRANRKGRAGREE